MELNEPGRQISETPDSYQKVNQSYFLTYIRLERGNIQYNFGFSAQEGFNISIHGIPPWNVKKQQCGKQKKQIAR